MATWEDRLFRAKNTACGGISVGGGSSAEGKAGLQCSDRHWGSRTPRSGSQIVSSLVQAAGLGTGTKTGFPTRECEGASRVVVVVESYSLS